MKPTVSAFCQHCQAWRGQLGAEPTIELYVSHLVEVLRRVRRVLRKDGVLLLNLGDSYASNWPCSRRNIIGNPSLPDGRREARPPRIQDGLKDKDLCEVPSDVVKALRADGWWLRSRIPWLKQNCMPESTTDRPTNAIEYWFMLTKASTYYWDPEAVRIPHRSTGKVVPWQEREHDQSMLARQQATGKKGRPKGVAGFGNGGRNRRNSDWLMESLQGLILDDLGGPLVMVVNPQGYDAEFCRACQRYYDGPDKKLVRREKYTGGDSKEHERRWCLCGRSDAWLSHYATFPERAIEPLILAATSERGCCPKCGAPWRRVVSGRGCEDRHLEKTHDRRDRYSGTHALTDPQSAGRRLLLNTKRARDSGRNHDAPFGGSTTLGWRPGCDCDASEPVPCVVADCFAGTSTVGVVAERLGRRAELIEVSGDYVAMSNARLAAARREPVEECDPALPLFREAG